MNLLLLQSCDLPDAATTPVPDIKIELRDRRAEHIYCVLHAQKGDRIRTGFLGGKLGYSEVVTCERHRAVLRLGSLDQEPPTPRNVIPIIALPRPQSFKKTLHFIASSGIKKAYFIGTDRVEKSYWKSAAMEPEAIREELILGLEQGVDTILPELVFRPYGKAFLQGEELAELVKTTQCLIAHPVNAMPCPRDLSKKKITIAIGPEGGFLNSEVASFVNAGFEKVELGPFILRVEFALSYICGRIS